MGVVGTAAGFASQTAEGTSALGNRELLEGARRCLLEKGFARTTARDIAAASGVSLAAIGYHFGTKDTLLTEALSQAISQWGDQLQKAFGRTSGRTPAERFEHLFASIAETFDANRPLWLATFELVMQADHNPTARDALRRALPTARTGLAAVLLGVDEAEVTTDLATSLGGALYALMAGTFIQRIGGAARVPGAGDVADEVLALGRWAFTA